MTYVNTFLEKNFVIWNVRMQIFYVAPFKDSVFVSIKLTVVYKFHINPAGLYKSYVRPWQTYLLLKV